MSIFEVTIFIFMMQFKFFVDGEWRHDERQPYVTGNYGVVNTVYLATETDAIHAIYNPETPGRSNMEVDNDMFPRLVRTICNINHEPPTLFVYSSFHYMKTESCE